MSVPLLQQLTHLLTHLQEEVLPTFHDQNIHTDNLRPLVLTSRLLHILLLMVSLRLNSLLRLYYVTDFASGTPCDEDGYDLPDAPSAPPIDDVEPIDFYPFGKCTEFEFAEFLYSEVEMSAGKIDKLLELLAALYPEHAPTFSDHKDLYQMIDNIRQGDISWDSFSVRYNGALPTSDTRPPWMDSTYEVWFRNHLLILESQISNRDFKDEVDYTPKRIFYKGKCRYQDLMSGNWAWEQAVRSNFLALAASSNYSFLSKDKIAQDVSTHGAMFAPVILGSDKTTVSVATGQNDYYPLYISLGNVRNAVRRAHRNAVSLLAFLAIPKSKHLGHFIQCCNTNCEPI